MSVYVVRAFVHLRELLSSNRELARRFAQLETRLDKKSSKIARPFAEDVREHLEARMKHPDAQWLLKMRKMRVEHPFGHIKHNLGIRSFLLRGLIGVRAEVSLAAAAFNLTRMIKLVGMRDLLRRLDEQAA